MDHGVREEACITDIPSELLFHMRCMVAGRRDENSDCGTILSLLPFAMDGSFGFELLGVSP